MNLELSLSQIANAVSGALQGNDTTINSISIDTRTIKPGELFWAINGETFDGHNFIDQAFERGAAAAVVSRPSSSSKPQVIVIDTRNALGHLAAYQREKYNIPAVAVTGSCGKTTSRMMLATVLSERGSVLASRSSFNNDVGLPLTLLGLTEQHQYCVLEAGTNHFGELHYLAGIAKPHVAIITCIAPVHTEYFIDTDGVARAKGELLQGLNSDGVAVLEADGKYTPYFSSLLTTQKIITFGLNDNADVRASNVETLPNGHSRFTLTSAYGSTTIELPLLGKHNILNALAVSAATLAMGVSIEDVQHGLAKVQAESKRLVENISVNGAVVIDDSYNANPIAVHAAIDVLASRPEKNKILVLGDMGELGEKAAFYHAEVGHYAKQSNISAIYAWGKLTMHAVDAFGDAARHFSDKEQLTLFLKSIAQDDHCLLIKGSRSTKMETIVKELTAPGVIA